MVKVCECADGVHPRRLEEGISGRHVIVALQSWQPSVPGWYRLHMLSCRGRLKSRATQSSRKLGSTT
jgi:hypothetical protein